MSADEDIANVVPLYEGEVTKELDGGLALKQMYLCLGFIAAQKWTIAGEEVDALIAKLQALRHGPKILFSKVEDYTSWDAPKDSGSMELEELIERSRALEKRRQEAMREWSWERLLGKKED